MHDSRKFVPLSALVLAATHFAACGSPDTQKEETLAARGVLEGHYVLAVKGSVGAVLSIDNTPSNQRQPASLTSKTIDEEPPSIILEVDSRMPKALFGWIGESMTNGYVVMSGEIHACDSMYRSQSVREFTNAFISEVAFPPFAGDSKDAVALMVKLTAQSVEATKGEGQKLAIESPWIKYQWLACNYRFSLDPMPTSNVVKIDGFKWRQELAKSRLGSTRTSIGATTQISPTNLKVTIAMRDWDTWKDWVDTSLAGETQKLSGSLELLSPDLSQALVTLFLSDVAIVKLSLSGAEANKEGISTFVAELTVGRMTFSP